MYNSDKPITSLSDDLLSRDHFTNALANTICNIDNHDTYTIGVYGKWGCGKTSIVNMAIDVVKHKKNRQITVIPFEAWNCMSEEQLLAQFFSRLSNELTNSEDKAISKIGSMISDYAGIYDLIEQVPTVGKIASIIARITGNRIVQRGSSFASADLYAQKERITQALKKVNKRFLIVIDDIDRLSDMQIRLIFQLVKEVANFPNITYLLIYDREIVVAALDETQRGCGEEYLEKIVQMPIGVPDTPKNQLEDILEKKLRELAIEYGVNYSDERLEEIESWIYKLNASSIREINRLCNALECKLPLIHNSVDFYDYVLLTIIELKYYKLYCWIRNNKNVLVDLKYKEDDEACVPLVGKDREYYVTKIKEQCSINDDELAIIIGLLQDFFPVFNKKTRNGRYSVRSDFYLTVNSICSISRFDRYFQCDAKNVTGFSMDIDAIMQIQKVEDIERFYKKYSDENLLGDFLRELKAKIVYEAVKNPFLLFPIMLNSIGKMQKYLNGYGEKRLVNAICEELLLCVPKDEQCNAVLEAVAMADSETVYSLISFIKTVMERGVFSNDTQRVIVISNDDLDYIYDVLAGKIRGLLESTPIFDMKPYGKIEQFLQSINRNDILNEHCDKMGNDPRIRLWKNIKNVVVNEKEETYSLKLSYRMSIDDVDPIKEDVLSCLYSDQFFELDELMQHKICALWLLLCEDPNKRSEVRERYDVIPKIEEWKKDKI